MIVFEDAIILSNQGKRNFGEDNRCIDVQLITKKFFLEKKTFGSLKYINTHEIQTPVIVEP